MSYLLLATCLVLCSCSVPRMVETDLYFGQSKPGGGTITENEWKSFKEDHIDRVFKEGSTVIKATGNWYDPVSQKAITEPTYVVAYFYKKSAPVSRQIDSLRYWYKHRFQQQSVLRVDKKVKATF